MYQLTIQREFCAAHAIVMKGEREPVHGHNWRVSVVVEGDDLDDDGLLCDFHWLEQQVGAVLAPLANSDLNAAAAFRDLNPTAEHVARHIADAVADRLDGAVRLVQVSVTEAPGCVATYRL